MDKTTRFRIVQTISFSTSSPKDVSNSINSSASFQQLINRTNKRKLLNPDIERRTSVAYACRGVVICRNLL